MSSWLLSFILPVVFLLLFILPVAMIYFWRKRHVANRRSPLTQMLLRGPGESLRTALDDAHEEMMFNVLMLPIVPLMLYAMHISQSYFFGQKETMMRVLIDGLAALIGIGYFLFVILKKAQRVSRLRQGYEGEVAVAQELNTLMRDGFHVFHDVPADGFNIDHVVIGPKGIFAVETKSRMKPHKQGKMDLRMIYDGKALCFPGWTETRPLDQASRQAKWLAKHLGEMLGERVDVKPVLALPGWYVDLKGKGDVAIINGKNAPAIFSRLFHSEIPADMMARVATYLEQRCRDVEPRNFQKRGNAAYLG